MPKNTFDIQTSSCETYHDLSVDAWLKKSPRQIQRTLLYVLRNIDSQQEALIKWPIKKT